VEGVIVGTLQYMSPEQLEGRVADHRSDIFSCGVLLYEMVTGRRPFDGSSQAGIMAAILKEEPPPMRAANPRVPAALERVVATCLAKDPEDRWQSSADLARALQWIAESRDTVGGSPATAPRRAWIWIGVTAVLAGAIVAALATLAWRARSAEPAVAYRTSVMLPSGLRFPGAGSIGALARFALSPDRRQLAFVAVDESGAQMLWVRPLDSLDARLIPGTNGASSPFWSPDSRSIAYVADRQLRRVDLGGGLPSLLAEPAFNTTGAWSEDGVILFTPTAQAPLHQVPAAGGAPSPVTTLDVSAGDVTHRSPFFLPGGRRFLYGAIGGPGGTGAARAVYVGSLDGEAPRLVLENGTDAKYAGGRLLYLRERTLLARPFDSDALTFAGEPAIVVEDVDLIGGSLGAFSVAGELLAYQPEAGQGTQLVWFDREGRSLGPVGDAASYGDVELSPDGRQAAVSVLDPVTNTRDIWLVDLERGVRTRFTSDPADDVAPIWSADGTRVIFTSARRGHFDLYVKPAGGVGQEELLYADEMEKYPTSWSPDGESILYWTFDAAGTNVWVLTPGEEGKPRSLLGPGLSPGRFSPDGRWVAYFASDSGRSEVYVVPFPDASRRWQVSAAGGNFSRWSASGREIIYVSQNRLMRVPVTAGPDGRFEAGAPEVMFAARPVGPRYFYDVAPDGQRLLLNTVRDETASSSITLVQNWAEAVAP
jgi:Tol biopolymer transport system component